MHGAYNIMFRAIEGNGEGGGANNFFKRASMPPHAPLRL